MVKVIVRVLRITYSVIISYIYIYIFSFFFVVVKKEITSPCKEDKNLIPEILENKPNSYILIQVKIMYIPM